MFSYETRMSTKLCDRGKGVMAAVSFLSRREWSTSGVVWICWT